MDLNYDSAFSVVLSLTMFCQKSPGHLDLAALVDTSGIQHVSVHATCSLVPSISSIDRRMHILWSRVGLEEVVDGRGCLYLCLSFDQCANYQSNLDGRPLDVVCRGEESRGSLNFIQVYGDSPTHPHEPPLQTFSEWGDHRVWPDAQECQHCHEQLCTEIHGTHG